MFDTSLLPHVNATLNGLAAVLLVGGFTCIRNGWRTAHRRCMLAAFAASALFLGSYITYHATHLATPFPGQGAARGVYYTILVSHILLAIAVVPLALTVLYRARREDFPRHRRLARWTLPIWLYVSVTGVVVYWMLYRIHWAPVGPG
jgi:putative membrane protein